MSGDQIHFDARDGVRLEGILEWPPGAHARPAGTPASPDSAGATAQPARLRAVIITHSHSMQAGGHMYAHILRAVAASLVERGFAVLRFNFRGVQGSAGAFGDGRAELLDVGGAVDYLRAEPRIDPASIALFGYSFGARVCLPYAAGDPAIRALATLGMPARRFLHEPPRFHGPLLLVAGSADHVLPPEHIARFLALYPNASAHILPGADHFYRAHTAAAGAAVAAFLAEARESQ